MNPTKILLALLAIYVAGYICHTALLRKTVYGDGVYYYSWLPTLALDHDTDFSNQYDEAGVTQPRTKKGTPANKYSIAPALFWMPAFVSIRDHSATTGFEFPYQFAVGLSGVFAAWIGLLLLYTMLIKRGYGIAVSLSSVLCVAMATNLLFYGSIDTVNSHALSFLTATVLLTLLTEHTVRWSAAGIIAGIGMLIRPQDIILAIPALFFIKEHRSAVKFIAPVATLMLFQLGILYSVYGTFMVSPYISSIEGFSPFTPNVLGVLFSFRSGLFLWTPAFAIGVAGLFIARKNKFALMCLTVFIVQLYIVSAWSVWWQGESYSGRMFVSVLPTIALGVAEVFRRLTKFRFRYKELMYGIVIPLSVINAISIVYFLLVVQN